MRILRSVAVVITALIGFTLGAIAPAVAADELGLSLDGVTWTEALTMPLFDPDMVWVPGDVEDGQFFFRNQSTDEATYQVSATIEDAGELLAQGDMVLSAAVNGGPWQPAANINGEDTVLLAEGDISPDEVITMGLQVEFLTTSGNRSQRQQLILASRVLLTADTVEIDPGGTSPEDPEPGKEGEPGEVSPSEIDPTDPGATDPDPGDGSTTADDNQAAGAGTEIEPPPQSAGILPASGAPPVGGLIGLAAIFIGMGIALLKRRGKPHEVSY